MIFEKYFFKNYFKYLFLINLSFTLLFNFIEFFEKMARTKNVSIETILQFILLNLGPSFFESIKISSWLSAIMVIKEFHDQNELETFKILNINNKKLFNLFLISGIIISLISFIGRENITLKLQNKSEQFKFKQLKKINRENVTNKWLEIKSHNNKLHKSYCYFQSLNLINNTGTNIILLDIDENFKIYKIINSQKFQIKPSREIIELKKPNIVKINSNNYKNPKNKILHMPSFFSQLKMEDKIPPLSLFLKNIFLEKDFLPQNIWFNMISELLKRIFFYLQIIIYPVLTFCLFILFENFLRYKWTIMFAPYPIILLTDLLTNFLAKFNLNPIILLLPYLLIFLFIFFSIKSIEKNNL
ncbi:LptF/LptG family permease [Candidatus Dependentiae bacterium]|nr:LptF/LptG family permease [Candidatus Dependentiae bacterium]MBU4387043.1 LptF/LptG family permease [Candidatus Dependentiae bacterium]